MERLEFHRSRFEDGEGEKEKKRRKRRFGSKEEEEGDLEKTGFEEENLEMENADDEERRRRSKLDLMKKEIWIWRTCRTLKKKKRGEVGELCRNLSL